jgi:hypothetical protein
MSFRERLIFDRSDPEKNMKLIQKKNKSEFPTNFIDKHEHIYLLKIKTR